MNRRTNPIFLRELWALHAKAVRRPWWYYHAPWLAWMLFIAWASLTPPRYLPLSGFVWAHKVGHTVCYAILAALVLRAWRPGTRPTLRAALGAWLVCLFWGAFMEVMQSLTPQRTPSVMDALVDGLGAAVREAGWLLAVLHRRRKP